jgi:RNA polymerase II elongation factor ELL
MRSQKEDSPHELYLRSSSAAKPMAPLKLYANVTGKFMVERELGEKVQDKVRDRTQVAEKQRTERKVQMLDSPLDLPRANGKKRKAPSTSSSLLKQAAHNDHLRNISSVSSVVPSRVASPLPPSTTAPTASTPTATKDSSIRRLMIQYLAISPRSTDEVMRAIGGADCDSATRRTLFEYLDEVCTCSP